MTIADLEAPLQAALAAAILYLPRVLSAVILFAVGMWLAGWCARVARQSFAKRGTDPELALLMTRVVRITVAVLATVGALQQIDFDLTGFVAGLGIVGFTVGFALQDVSKNFIAGLLLLLQQPFDIGDAIEVSGTAGVVTHINLRATEIRTFDGLTVLIPNTDVYIKVVKRFGADHRRRIGLSVLVESPDSGQVRDVVRRALEGIPGVDPEADPSAKIVVEAVDTTTTQLTAYVWVDLSAASLLDAQEHLLDAVKQALSTEALPPKRLALTATWPDAIGGVGAGAS